MFTSIKKNTVNEDDWVYDDDDFGGNNSRTDCGISNKLTNSFKTVQRHAPLKKKKKKDVRDSLSSHSSSESLNHWVHYSDLNLTDNDYFGNDMDESNSNNSDLELQTHLIEQLFANQIPNHSPKPFILLEEQAVELIGSDIIETFGVHHWIHYFSLKAEILVHAKHYSIALLNSLASEILNGTSVHTYSLHLKKLIKKHQLKSMQTTTAHTKKNVACSDIRNLATRFICSYQLGYKNIAEELKGVLLKIPYNQVEFNLSSMLLKVVENTMDVIDFVPEFIKYLAQEHDEQQHNLINTETHLFKDEKPQNRGHSIQSAKKKKIF